MTGRDGDDVGGAGLAGESDAAPEAIAALYDTWAAASYDDDVVGWGYEAPERAAALVAAHLGDNLGEVLDAGCGTGRGGAALQAVGIRDIVGGDFTPASIEAARTRGVYTTVEYLDLNDRLDYVDDRFAATVSVGVFSYLTETAATLRELLRIVRPGGAVIFTQRTDLWHERNCDELLRSLVADGFCTATTSDPQPYLPGHPDFGDSIGIIYTTLTVATTP